MHFEGKLRIEAPRQQVWEFLTDPKQVAECAPGLESLDVLEPGRKFRVVSAVGFGTIKARFTSDVEWTELEAPARAAMKAHGNAPGSAVDATSAMVLSDADGNATDLAWTADVTVVGTIASLAARLMGGVTQKLTGAFFESVKKKIEQKKPATGK
jgi:carbon monoxide dehydrogenase subunit G